MPTRCPRVAQLADEAIDQRRLAGARRTGHADGVGAAAAPVNPAEHHRRLRVAVLDQRDQPGEGDAIASQHPVDESGGTHTSDCGITQPPERGNQRWQCQRASTARRAALRRHADAC